MLKLIVIKLIEIYQKTLSPDTGWFSHRHPGGFCRYTPTCSEYCRESVEKYGVAKGLAKGAWRILRCNPLSKGGYDPA